LLPEKTRESMKESGLAKFFHQCMAEFFGTLFIVLFGVGSVCSAVSSGMLMGLWQVAVVWGFGVALAIYATAAVSSAHLNPAVTLACAVTGRFPFRLVVPYWVAQMLGGFVGGLINLSVFGPLINAMEDDHGVTTAMMFGEYFPHPGLDGNVPDVSVGHALGVEAWGTGILMFIILVLTDPSNCCLRNKDAAPLLIGFTVAVLISCYAPLTQAGFNPARDFGPRLAAALAGWGETAIPGPRSGFWVYVVGPLLGAPLGAVLYDQTMGPAMNMGHRRGVCCKHQDE